MTSSALRIAVILPCYNEGKTIADTVRQFRDALPGARIAVFDNNSSDDTRSRAREAGAEVWTERYQGKGNVVRRMLSEVEADVYVMADGDATYHADSAPAMIERLQSEHLDMVVGRRVTDDAAAYRSGHRWGNRLLSGAVRHIFGRTMSDILSGYRVMSRRFAKSFPATSEGFEIETELTVHALELRLPVAEVDTPYFARPEGSTSKLNTWRDGFRILGTIARLFLLVQPFRFFSLLALLFATVAVALFVPVLTEYFQTGFVTRLPSLIVAASSAVLALIAFVVGVILHTTTTGRLEAKRFAYLAVTPTGHR